MAFVFVVFDKFGFLAFMLSFDPDAYKHQINKLDISAGQKTVHDTQNQMKYKKQLCT